MTEQQPPLLIMIDEAAALMNTPEARHLIEGLLRTGRTTAVRQSSRRLPRTYQLQYPTLTEHHATGKPGAAIRVARDRRSPAVARPV